MIGVGNLLHRLGSSGTTERTAAFPGMRLGDNPKVRSAEDSLRNKKILLLELLESRESNK